MKKRRMVRARAILAAFIVGLAEAATAQKLSLETLRTDSGHVSGKINEDKPPDYFFLVQQWGPTYCEQGCQQPPGGIQEVFTIHGLWPEYSDGSYPSYCDPSKPFDLNLVKDLNDQLNQYWPSFDGNPDSFWKHEWEKHGTCALPFIDDEHSFFETTLHLREEYDIASILSNAGFKPSNTDMYRAADVAAAIANGIGVEPYIHCSSNDILEIWACINTGTLEYEKCPQAVIQSFQERRSAGSTTCGDMIRLPCKP